jgi:hypothetical protein
MVLDGLAELFTSITAVGENVSELGRPKTHVAQHVDRHVVVLNIGGMDQNEGQKTAGVAALAFGSVMNVTCASIDLLAGVKANKYHRFRCF